MSQRPRHNWPKILPLDGQTILPLGQVLWIGMLGAI